MPENDGNDDGDGKYPDAFRRGSKDQKDAGGQFADSLAETPLHQLVGGDTFRRGNSAAGTASR